MVVFHLFVRPLVRLLGGSAADTGLVRILARVDQPIASAIGREEYVRVTLSYGQAAHEPPLAIPVYGKSGLIRPLVQADGLLIIDRDSEGLANGSLAPVLLLPA